MGKIPPVTPFRPRDADESGAGGEPGQHVVVLSGLSGAGKTAATKLFEDLGYACGDDALPRPTVPVRSHTARGAAGTARGSHREPSQPIPGKVVDPRVAQVLEE